MAKQSMVARAALGANRDAKLDLYYEDSWGAGYMAVVRYLGEKHVDTKTWNSNMVNPRWLLTKKSGWGLPWEEEFIDSEAALTERMREIQPDLRRWKTRHVWSGGKWW